MIKRILSVVLVLCVVLSLATMLSGCSVNYPFKKGAKVEQSISVDKEYPVGDISKTGWQLNVPKNTFDENTTITMNVLTNSENEKYKSTAFDFVGTVVEITAGNEKSVRLNKPVTITMKIPNDQKPTKEKVDDYLVGYWTGEYWEYIFPSIGDLNKGIVSFETYHFSPYGTIKLTEDEKVKLYTKKMALQTFEDEENEKALSDKVQGMFNEAFEKMGISDSSMQGKLFRSIAKEYDFGSLLVSTERGDMADFSVKCGEMAANALIKHYSLEKALMDKFTQKGAAVATGLGKAAIQIYDGNYTDAAKELSSAFIGYFPTGRAFQAAVEIVDAGISTWKDYELDAAYKSYLGAVNNGAFGYKIQAGDWDTLCVQMRGYLVRLQDEAKNNYCAVNKISRSKLDKDTVLSKRIADQTAANLKTKFENRLANKQNIEKKEAEYGKIIEGFKKSLLLERGTFGFDFEDDIQDRLRSLFAARKIILDMVGGKMPVSSISDSAENNLNEAIGKWLSLGPKKRGEFYKWMKEKGYVKENTVLSGGSAWVLANTVDFDGGEIPKSEAYKYIRSYASGSYSYTTTYIGKTDTYYNPPTKNGESFASQAIWSTPPERIEAGEIVSLTLSFSVTVDTQSYYNWSASAGAYFDKADMTPGFASGEAVDFVDANGKDSFSVSRKTPSVSASVTAIAPAGGEGKKIALLTTYFPGIKMGTAYIYEWKSVS